MSTHEQLIGQHVRTSDGLWGRVVLVSVTGQAQIELPNGTTIWRSVDALKAQTRRHPVVQQATATPPPTPLLQRIEDELRDANAESTRLYTLDERAWETHAIRDTVSRLAHERDRLTGSDQAGWVHTGLHPKRCASCGADGTQRTTTSQTRFAYCDACWAAAFVMPVDVRQRVTQCQWFALCTNHATTTRRHPVLGDVPICERCDHRVAVIDATTGA